MNSVSDSIAWPTHDPQWISKVVLMGLITLIPLVGWLIGMINLLGWMYAAVDNLRAGREELPRAGFGYLGRGVPLFVVLLVYSLVIAIAAGIVIGAGFVITAVGGQVQGGALLSGLGFLITLAGYAVAVVLGLGLALLLPVIALRTEAGGIGAGLNVGEVVEVAHAHQSPALYAGLFAIIGNLIGGLGGLLCGIGGFLTVAYGYAILAGVVRYLELALVPPAWPQPAPAASPQF